MLKNNVENNNVETKNTNKQYDDGKATFNFGQVVGKFGKFSNYKKVGNKNTPMLHFSLDTMNANGYYTYVPFTAWGKTAELLHQNAKANQMVGVGYSLTSNLLTNANNHKQYFDDATVFTLYSQLNGYYNVGKIIGNFDKFSHYGLVGKKQTPLLKLRLSVRDYNGNFHNIPMNVWGKLATKMNNELHAQDFIEVAYSLGSDKLALAQNKSMNVAQPNVTNFRVLKPAQATTPQKPSNHIHSAKHNQSSADIKNSTHSKQITDNDLPF